MNFPVRAALVEQPHDPAPRGLVIAVWGPSGSPGASTVAASLAAVLAWQCQVILVDCDATRGTLATALTRSGTGMTLGGAILTLPPHGVALPAGFLRELPWGGRFLPGVVGPAAPVAVRPERVGMLLDRLRDEANALVLDLGDELPRRAGCELHAEALKRADIVVVVGQDTPQGQLDIQGELPLLHETLAGLGHSPTLLGVVNHLENAHFALWRHLLRDYGLPMAGHVPHDRLGALRAWERRQPLTVADPSGVAAAALTAFGGEVAKTLGLALKAG